MDGMNRNNMGDYIPQEIPIPEIGEDRSRREEGRHSGQSKGQNQSRDYGNTNSQPGQYGGQGEEQSQSWDYGNTNSQPGQYGSQGEEQNHSRNYISPYSQPEQYSSPYDQAGHAPYWNQNQPQFQGYGSSHGQRTTAYDSNRAKKGSAIKILIGIVCAFVVIFAIGIGGLAYYRSTPVYRISRGFYNLGREIGQIQNPLFEKLGLGEILLMTQEEGSHVETKLNFSAELPMIGTTTLGVDTDYEKDVKGKELNASTVFSLMNYEFAHLDVYANEEAFCFSLPELFLENIYVDNENVVSQYNESVFAQVAGQSTLQDFSIELFPDMEEKTSAREWRSLSAMLERFEEDLKACKDGMTVEKVENGLYRVTLPGKETNRLVKNLLDSYGKVYKIAESEQGWNDYKNLLASDISLVFEINNKNRIESVILEEPVKVMEGKFFLSGEIFMLGDQRSIDKVQGKLIVENDDQESAEIICQIVQTTGDEKYRMDLDLKYTEGDDNGKIKYTLDCNAAQDEIEMTFSMKDKTDNLGMSLQGTVEDYEKGRSVEFDLDKLTFTMDGSDTYTISGDVEVEPLQGRVNPTVKAETALFKMDLSDWQKIIYQLDDAYGSILEYLW